MNYRRRYEPLLLETLEACGQRNFRLTMEGDLAELKLEHGATFWFIWDELCEALMAPIVWWLAERDAGRLAPVPIVQIYTDLSVNGITYTMTIGAWHRSLREEKRERRAQAKLVARAP